MFGKEAIRRAASFAGLDVFWHKPGGWHWSHTVETYYPVSPKPRWGHGKPLHDQLKAALDAQREQFDELLKQMTAAKFILEAIPTEASDESLPWWANPYFSSLDGAALVGMLLLEKPKKYIEIGSGNSTKFARFTIERAKLATKLTSIDPYPRAEIDALCDSLIRKPFEDCSTIVLDELESGDILFFDGSHRSFTNSDVTVFFLEVLPRLPRGVIVQIHDIFLPADYPPEWNKRMYSEQYLLAAMLLGKSPPFRTLLPNYYACIDPNLSRLVAAVVQPHMKTLFGGSFWIETT